MKSVVVSSRAAGGNAQGSAGATFKPLSAVVQEEVPAWQRPPNRQSDTRLRGRTESCRRPPPPPSSQSHVAVLAASGYHYGSYL